LLFAFNDETLFEMYLLNAGSFSNNSDVSRSSRSRRPSHYPHNSNPKPANAAALLKQEEAATSAAGAFDTDSSGSDATAE
jgi:hypothetical protein